MKHVHVSDQIPPDFHPAMEASACYVTCKGELLLLQQAPHKKDAGRWGVPAGKFEPGETPLQAAQRELMEETHLSFPSSELSYLTSLSIRLSDLDYLYHMFAIDLPQKPPIHLSSEHAAYRWIPLEELSTLPLRTAAIEALPLYYKYKDTPLKTRLHFAPALPSQRPLIHHWLAQPHIAQWIHGQGLQNTLHGLDAFFRGASDTTYWIGFAQGLCTGQNLRFSSERDKTGKSRTMKPIAEGAMGEEEGLSCEVAAPRGAQILSGTEAQKVPFSFLITSPEGDDATTLDLFICDPSYLGKGLSIPMIRTFLLTHFSHLPRVLIDPESTNRRAIHVYEQVGFKITGEFIAPWHPVPHYQMELRMCDLMQEGR